MCYSAPVERIAVRELRNQASRVVSRARSGERLIITVDGVPAAEIGPVGPADRGTSMAELIAVGAVLGPRVAAAPRPPEPVRAPSGLSSAGVLRELRER